MSGARTVIAVATSAIVACAAVGGLIAGASAAADAAIGGLAGGSVQVAATVLLLRVHGATTERFLRGFGRAAALRVFGSAIFVLVALATGQVSPAPFLAGFGFAYLVLEVVADVLFVRNEKQLNLDVRGVDVHGG